MLIIEALKKIKYNRGKVDDLSRKIQQQAAHHSLSDAQFVNAKANIKSFVDSIRDTQRENEVLSLNLAKTNTTVTVSVEIGGKTVTKTIHEWIVRRREGIDLELRSYSAMTHRLKPEVIKGADGGDPVINSVVENYDSTKRDKMISQLHEERMLIDAALEIVNATTSILEQ